MNVEAAQLELERAMKALRTALSALERFGTAVRGHEHLSGGAIFARADVDAAMRRVHNLEAHVAGRGRVVATNRMRKRA